jgi:hypothetical protein
MFTFSQNANIILKGVVDCVFNWSRTYHPMYERTSSSMLFVHRPVRRSALRVLHASKPLITEHLEATFTLDNRLTRLQMIAHQFSEPDPDA